MTPKLIWSRTLSAYDGEIIVFDEQYSYLDIVFYGAIDQPVLYTARMFPGNYILENMCDFLLRQRGITFNNGINLTIGNGSSRQYNGTANTNNTVCIPTAIYGYKKS